MPSHPSTLATLVQPLLAATQQAALAADAWTGRHDGLAADGAAVAAMRRALRDVPGCGRVVIGEGAKDEAPMIAVGEEVGTGTGPAFDLAVDPLEHTTACAAGTPGAITLLAAASAGTVLATPAWYMDKLVVGPRAAGLLDLRRPLEANLAALATALDVPRQALRVVVMAKPRHADLIARLRDLGVVVHLIPGGDVMGALRVLLPEGDADLLVGVGGAPEGVITACAARLLGGTMQGRLAPQSSAEATAIARAGQSTTEVLSEHDMISGEDCVLVATGVTPAPPLAGVVTDPSSGVQRTSSLVLATGRGALVVEGMHRVAGTHPVEAPLAGAGVRRA